MVGAGFLFVFLCGCLYIERNRKWLYSKFASNSLHDKKSNNALQQHIDVTLPDMFQTFLKLPPKVNSHYKAVKLESEEWLSRYADSVHIAPTIVNLDSDSARMEKRQRILYTGVTSHILFLYPLLSHLRLSFEPSVTGVIGYVAHVSWTRYEPDIMDEQVFPFDDSKTFELFILPQSSLILGSV